MGVIYDDGLAWTTARPDGDYVVQRPFFTQGDSSHKVISWPHVVARGSYSPLALDTAHPDDASALLVDERNFEDIGGNLTRFFRIYATVPATRSDYETFTHQFLTLYDQDDSGAVSVRITLRPARSVTVTSRVEREYFNTSDPSTITLNTEFVPLRNINGNIVERQYVASAETDIETIPNLSEYLAMDEVIAEPSELRRYKGNIWELSTRYVPTTYADPLET